MSLFIYFIEHHTQWYTKRVRKLKNMSTYIIVMEIEKKNIYFILAKLSCQYGGHLEFLRACTYNLKNIKIIVDKFKIINDVTSQYKCLSDIATISSLNNTSDGAIVDDLPLKCNNKTCTPIKLNIILIYNI